MNEGFYLFLSGLLVGSGLTYLGTILYHKRKAKVFAKKFVDDLFGDKEDFFEKMTKDFESLHGGNSDRSAIDDRLKEVDKLQKELMGLAIASDEPQRNSLDGRHRQGNYGTAQTLQDKIHEILQSILDDGHDPILAVSGPDGVQPLKLSEIMEKEGFIANKDREKKEEVKGERETTGGTLLQLVKPKAELPPIPTESEE